MDAHGQKHNNGTGVQQRTAEGTSFRRNNVIVEDRDAPITADVRDLNMVSRKRPRRNRPRSRAHRLLKTNPKQSKMLQSTSQGTSS